MDTALPDEMVNGLLFPRRYVEQVTSPDILPLTLKTHTFMYLPIYVVSHSVANFYFPAFL